MITPLLATLVGLMGVTQPATNTQRPTYIVKMTDGTTLRGFVENENADPLVFEYDTGPEKGSKRYIPQSKIDVVLDESRVDREARRKKAAEAAAQALKAQGFTMVDGLKEPTEEVEFARRARAMVKAEMKRRMALGARRPAAPTPAKKTTRKTAPRRSSAMDLLTGRGGQLAVGIVGLVLIAIIVRTMLL